MPTISFLQQTSRFLSDFRRGQFLPLLAILFAHLHCGNEDHGERSFEHTHGLMKIGPDGSVTPGSDSEEWASSGVQQLLHEAVEAVCDYVHQLPPPAELMDHAQRRYYYYLWRWARNRQIP